MSRPITRLWYYIDTNNPSRIYCIFGLNTFFISAFLEQETSHSLGIVVHRTTTHIYCMFFYIFLYIVKKNTHYNNKKRKFPPWKNGENIFQESQQETCSNLKSYRRGCQNSILWSKRIPNLVAFPPTYNILYHSLVNKIYTPQKPLFPSPLRF